jgi:hypothetical protein
VSFRKNLTAIQPAIIRLTKNSCSTQKFFNFSVEHIMLSKLNGLLKAKEKLQKKYKLAGSIAPDFAEEVMTESKAKDAFYPYKRAFLVYDLKKAEQSVLQNKNPAYESSLLFGVKLAKNALEKYDDICHHKETIALVEESLATIKRPAEDLAMLKRMLKKSVDNLAKKENELENYIALILDRILEACQTLRKSNVSQETSIKARIC